MRKDKVILLLLLGCLVCMSGIALFYKLDSDRMDKRVRDVDATSTTANNVTTALQDLSGFYRRTRIGVCLSELRSQNDPLIVLFGDSIMEQAYFPALDGINTFNAGISGAKALESLEFVADVLAASNGPLVILALGVNDAFGPPVTTPEQFAAVYESLVSAILASGRKAVLVTLPPLENDKSESQLFSGTNLDTYNAVVRAAGARHGLLVADINAVLTKLRLKTLVSQTVDGVHLTPAATVVWRDTVYAAARQALAQSGK